VQWGESIGGPLDIPQVELAAMLPGGCEVLKKFS
jgi:hypothetical protein